MQLLRILLTTITIFVNLSLATASTRLPFANLTNPPCCPDRIANALVAGVDPYGPIPEDYGYRVRQGYHFAAGSNASLWVLAQLDMVGRPVQQKRATEGYQVGGSPQCKRNRRRAGLILDHLLIVSSCRQASGSAGSRVQDARVVALGSTMSCMMYSTMALRRSITSWG